MKRPASEALWEQNWQIGKMMTILWWQDLRPKRYESLTLLVRPSCMSHHQHSRIWNGNWSKHCISFAKKRCKWQNVHLTKVRLAVRWFPPSQFSTILNRAWNQVFPFSSPKYSFLSIFSIFTQICPFHPTLPIFTSSSLLSPSSSISSEFDDCNFAESR